MPITVNLRHLKDNELALRGELPVAELELDLHDEALLLRENLGYEIEVQLLDGNLLARGVLRLPLDCQCVRCLTPFRQLLEIPDWTCLLALEGEEAVPIVGDGVNLTTFVREDILLGLPQHPVCKPGCAGLIQSLARKQKTKGNASRLETGSSTWAGLDDLKL